MAAEFHTNYRLGQHSGTGSFTLEELHRQLGITPPPQSYSGSTRFKNSALRLEDGGRAMFVHEAGQENVHVVVEARNRAKQIVETTIQRISIDTASVDERRQMLVEVLEGYGLTPSLTPPSRPSLEEMTAPGLSAMEIRVHQIDLSRADFTF